MVDELMMLRLTGGLGLDVPALLAFIAFGVVYLIAPAITHTRERPFWMAAALYLLVLYAALSLFQLILQWFQLLDGGNPGVLHQGFPGAEPWGCTSSSALPC